MEEKFIKAVLAVQGELKAPKGQYNSFGKYNYRSCEDILEAVKPLCVKHGLILTISDHPTVIGERYYICALATLTDGKDTISNTAYAREADMKTGMDASQLTGACSSYARKYALNGLFCIDDTKDADTMDNRNEGKKTVKAEPKPNVVKSVSDGELSSALDEVAGVESADELTYIWNKYKGSIGKNPEFVKAIASSPFNPKNKKK